MTNLAHRLSLLFWSLADLFTRAAVFLDSQTEPMPGSVQVQMDQAVAAQTFIRQQNAPADTPKMQQSPEQPEREPWLTQNERQPIGAPDWL